MAILLSIPCLKKKQRGLTLIEVLIALVIMSIAIIAVMKAVSQSVRTSHYLQQKTTAAWIAEDAINGLHAGKEATDFSVTALGQKWYVVFKRNETDNQAIKEINVLVFPNEAAKEEENPMLTVDTYVYQGA